MALFSYCRSPLNILTLTAEHVRIRDQEEPLGRVGGKLSKLGREAAQRKKNIAGFVPPAGFGQAGGVSTTVVDRNRTALR